MHELKTYIATIQNENRDLFDIVLDRISHQSDVRQGNRISTIIPKDRETTYEVAAADEEIAILALSCPGEYIVYTEDRMEKHISEFIDERKL